MFHQASHTFSRTNFWGGSGYRFGFTGLERDDESKGEGNSLTTKFRFYDSRLGNWLSVDPLSSKFSSFSPYNYTEGNPILYMDRTGKGKQSTIVDMNGTVVGGKIDGDKGVYMVKGVTKENFDKSCIDNYKQAGVRIGTSASEYSFRTEEGQWMGHINLGSMDAYESISAALTVFQRDHPSPLFSQSAFDDYSSNAGNGGTYDIKSWGLPKGYTKEQYLMNSYEASWGPNGLIFTNRDAGNFVAGRVSEMMGIPWRIAEAGFGAFNGASNDRAH